MGRGRPLLSLVSTDSLLVRVVGRRPFAAFAAVSFLVVALLAAVNLTSHRALERYVADQIDRVPWDVSVYQTSEVPVAAEVREAITKTEGVTRVEDIHFLRTVLPEGIFPEVDGQSFRTPWLSMLSASDSNLLPPDIRPRGDGAILVLVGSRAQMGEAYLHLQNRKRFDVRADLTPEGEVAGGHSHDGSEAVADKSHLHNVLVFRVPLERTVRIDSNELNRWFLDKTSSPTLVPELGAILVVPDRRTLLSTFDSLSRGIVSHDEGVDAHANTGDYFPEIIHLAAVDRGRMISGWDIGGSLARLDALSTTLRDVVRAKSYSAAVDNTSAVLLGRMASIARQIDLIGLLVALPLLWMAWILMASLSNLLLLNERRKLGLLRLRGTPAASIRRVLLAVIAAAGIVGGLAGAAVGTVLPALGYRAGPLPWAELLGVQKPLYLLIFLAVGVAMALLVSLRFVNHASTISPLEASGRASASEASFGRIRFGWAQALALAVGGVKIAGWIVGWSALRAIDAPWAQALDRALDFVSFPLFVYGAGTLLASRARWMSLALAPIVFALSGKLAPFTLKHLAMRHHRLAAFLLIVAMMASVSLYPGVMTAVFDDKIERGAETQLGAAVQFSLDAPTLVPGLKLIEGGFRERYGALREAVGKTLEPLRARPEVDRVEFVVEGLADGLYMPGYGFSGVPVYFVDSAERYLATVPHESSLGASAPFTEVIRSTDENQVLVSRPVHLFYKRDPGMRMPVGRNVDKSMQVVTVGGVLHYLPGMPLKTVNDRQSFVAARVDYLNHLFGANAYLVGAGDNPWFNNLDVLLPRAVAVVRPRPGVTPATLHEVVRTAMPVAPIEIRDVAEETARLGSDMYIYLARQNFEIYLIGGLLLSIIGIVAVALSNHAEDRRTLALLRIRGCGPRALLAFSAPGLFAPSLVGLVLGALVALVVGFGITRLVWELRQILTILNLLPSHLAVSWQTAEVALLLIVMLLAIAYGFSRWIFRRSARESLLEN